MLEHSKSADTRLGMQHTRIGMQQIRDMFAVVGLELCVMLTRDCFTTKGRDTLIIAVFARFRPVPTRAGSGPGSRYLFPGTV